MTVITTVGTAERHLPAERATLVARVSVSDADRATAIAAAFSRTDLIFGQ